MAAACVYCGSTENLNTQLTISLDEGKRATVFVCDVHAEDASVKSAKAAYQERQKKIEEFKAVAASLGLTITETETTTPGGLIIPKVEKVQPSQATSQASVVAEEMTDPDMVDAKLVDARGRRGMVGTGGVVPVFGAVEAHSSYNLDDVLKGVPQGARNGKVKLESIQGRAGIPVAIPTKRIDSMGVTTVRVVETGGDQALQRRFKQMADATKTDRHAGFGPHGLGYELRVCPICHGTCTVSNRGSTVNCPKCGGEGEIVVAG